jgi:hypothetical protein
MAYEWRSLGIREPTRDLFNEVRNSARFHGLKQDEFLRALLLAVDHDELSEARMEIINSEMDESIDRISEKFDVSIEPEPAVVTDGGEADETED